MDCHSAEQLIQEFGFWILFGSTIPWTASTAEHGGIIHAIWLHEVPGVSKTPMFTQPYPIQPLLSYDKKSDEGSIWVPQGHESESAKIVLKQVKWTYFDAYLWQTMWNHAKNQWKGPNFQIQCFYNGPSGALCWKRQKTQKLEKLKHKLLNILKRYDLSGVVPCERARPEDSENVLVFES